MKSRLIPLSPACRIYAVVPHFEDVGDEFAAEVRRIHNRETEARDIRGEATQIEIDELKDEGIEPLAIPVRIVKKLN